MTPEQQRAIAIANARARAAEAESRAPVVAPTPEAAPDPTGNFLENTRAGLGRSYDQTLDALTQMYLGVRGEKSAGVALDDTIKEKRRLDKPLMDTVGGMVGQGIGDASQATLASIPAAGAAAKFLPKAIQAGRYGSAAFGSGAVEALKPVVDDESRMANAAGGAALGVVGQGVGDLASRGVTGLIKKGKDVLKLPASVQDAATLGQIADRTTIPGRAVSRLEESAQSVPLVGAAVRNRRTSGVDAWRDAVLERGIPDGFKPKGGNTREVIDSVQQEFSKRYKNALQGVKIVPEPDFESAVAKIAADPKNGLLPNQQKEVVDLVQGYYERMFQMSKQNPFGKASDASTAKDFEAFLTKLSKSYRMTANQNARAGAISDTIEAIEDTWTKAYRAQLTPEVQGKLVPLDKKYAPFKTLERAASYVGNDNGDFTTAQLLAAVKARTAGPQFAAGRGMLQKDAQAGKAVFGDKLPDSGTPERMLATTGGLGLLGYMDPAYAAVGMGIPMSGITKTGRNLAVGDTKMQKMLQKLRTQDVIDQLAGQGRGGQLLDSITGE